MKALETLVVIGQGYVGLPLASAASGAGYRVIGLDLNVEVVFALNAGRSHVDDLDDAEIQRMLEQGYRATQDVSAIGEADVVVICVPTPLSADGGPDLGAVKGACVSIAANLKPGTLVVLESTTYPGTTEDVVLPILESGGLRHREGFLLAFSPERVDPGNPVYGIKNTPKLVGGVTSEATDRAADFYGAFVDQVVSMSGTREAEMAKLLENTYRHVNIALVNEMARFCHDLSVDIWEVIRGASTKPFGFEAFRPGPGVGGHCIPIDPNYLSYEVRRQLGYSFRFVELAQEINSTMPRYVAERVLALLNAQKKSLNGSRVLLLGVTYKPNIADLRESPADKLAAELLSRGGEVLYHDPHVDSWLPGVERVSAEELYVALESVDVAVLLQNHAVFDLTRIACTSRKVLDCRGVMTGESVERL
jgi:UDP-N-acetyl-D-glucosamine dehydrogenase